MRLDDLCLVNTEVTVTDDFYRTDVGLERRFRNERFVDFLLGDGPRLAAWMRSGIGASPGDAYPAGPGAPFRITVELPGTHATGRTLGDAGVLVDPDGFRLVVGSGGSAGPRIVSAELAVGDIVASRHFLETLGFVESPGAPSDVDAPAVTFDAGAVTLTIVDRSTIDPEDPTWSQTGGHLMLAIELDTGEAVDAAHESLRSRGLAPSVAPGGYEWGSRSVFYIDPDDFIWEIYAWVEDPK